MYTEIQSWEPLIGRQMQAPKPETPGPAARGSPQGSQAGGSHTAPCPLVSISASSPVVSDGDMVSSEARGLLFSCINEPQEQPCREEDIIKAKPKWTV